MSVKHSIRIFFFIIALVYTGSLTAQEKAYPKNGEGITLFLKRFNRTGGTYQKEFIGLNKGKLGKNNTLRMGVKYTLPPLASAPSEEELSAPIRQVASQLQSNLFRFKGSLLLSGQRSWRSGPRGDR